MKLLANLILITFLFAGCGKDCERHLFLIRENGKMGYIDSTGKVIIEPIFHAAGKFVEGLAPARLNGDYGYIDQNGKFVIAEQFEYATPFSEGFAKVYLDRKPFFINQEGKKAFTGDFEEMLPFKNGRAEVKSASGNAGIINTEGKLIFDTVYQFISSFSRGYAVAYKQVGKKDKSKTEFGVMDSLGKTMIPFGKYDAIYTSNSGILMVHTKLKNGNPSTAFIDILDRTILSDTAILKHRLFRMMSPVEHEMISLDLWSPKHNRYHQAFINLERKLIINNPYIYRYGKIYGDRMFAENFHGKYALADSKGKLITKFIFDEAYYSDFKEGHSVVKVKGKYGVIDANGHFIIQPKWFSLDQIPDFKGHFYFRDSVNGPLGIIDYKGKIILKPAIIDYYSRSSLEHGLLQCFAGEKMIYVNRSGKIVWMEKDKKPTKREDLNMDYTNQGYFYVKTEVVDDNWVPTPNNGQIAEKIPADLQFPKGKLSIMAKPEQSTVFANRYNGFKVFVVNDSDTTTTFRRSIFNGELEIVMQAKDKKGNWIDLEETSTCGRDWFQMYPSAKLGAQQCWKFKAPVYSGSFKTRMRFKMQYNLDDSKAIYSEEFPGSINPAQLWRNYCYYWRRGNRYPDPWDMPYIR